MPKRLTTERHQALVNRLKTSRGHLDGVLKMLDVPEPDYVELLKQLKAVQGALQHLSNELFELHMHACLEHSRQGDVDEASADLSEALKYR